jgi:hypothetical protein
MSRRLCSPIARPAVPGTTRPAGRRLTDWLTELVLCRVASYQPASLASSPTAPLDPVFAPPPAITLLAFSFVRTEGDLFVNVRRHDSFERCLISATYTAGSDGVLWRMRRFCCGHNSVPATMFYHKKGWVGNSVPRPQDLLSPRFVTVSGTWRGGEPLCTLSPWIGVCLGGLEGTGHGPNRN